MTSNPKVELGDGTNMNLDCNNQGQEHCQTPVRHYASCYLWGTDKRSSSEALQCATGHPISMFDLVEATLSVLVIDMGLTIDSVLSMEVILAMGPVPVIKLVFAVDLGCP